MDEREQGRENLAPARGAGPAQVAVARDSALVSKAQRGDTEAFAELMRRYQTFLHRLTALYVGRRDAADVAQEIWMAVYRKLWQLEEDNRFRPWLRTLAYYRCLNYRKARARLRSREIYLDGDAWTRLAEWAAADDAGFESLLIGQDLTAAVGSLLDSLPGDFGLLLRLRYWQELSYRQIAETTLIPIHLVKWRLHKARSILKARISQKIYPKRSVLR